MRLPGAARATDWIAKARRYIAAHRALDEIESAALLAGVRAATAAEAHRQAFSPASLSRCKCEKDRGQ